MKKKELISFTYTDTALAVSSGAGRDTTTDYRHLIGVGSEMTDRGISVRISLPDVLSDDGLRVLATLVSSSGSVYYSSFVDGRCEINVPSPCLWWPTGLGIQNLYKLSISVYSGNEHRESLEYKLPLRTLSYNEAGNLCVNGMPFFVVAAAYDRLDRTVPDSLDDLRLALSNLRDIGFNAVALREGETLPHGFDALCDEYGLVMLPYADTQGLTVVGEDTYVYYAKSSEENILSKRSVSTYGDTTRAHKLLIDTVEEYSYPTDMTSLSFASSLNQGRVLARAIEQARISEARGILCYSFGEREAILSSSIFSPDLGRTPAHYILKRATTPTLAVINAENFASEIFISNESHSRFVGELRIRLNDFNNYTLFSLDLPLACEPFSLTKVIERDFTEYIGDRAGDVYLYCSLLEGQSTTQECIQLFTKHRELNLKKPNISYSVGGAYPDLYLTLSSDTFSRGVKVDFDGVDAYPSDNCLDITSASPIRLDIICKENLSREELESSVRISSVYDIGK